MLEFLKLLFVLVTRNPFAMGAALIALCYVIFITVFDVDCDTRRHIAVNPASVTCQ